MKNHMKNLSIVTFLVVVTAGCTSAPSRFYTLNSTAAGDDATNSNVAVIVGPVSIPAEVDRPQFTIQVAPNRVAVDEFNRWAAPLNDNIARVVAGDLTVLLGTPQVAASPAANFAVAYRVTINIQRFETVPGKSVLIDAVWVVRPPSNGAVQSGRTVASETVSDDSYDSLAAAHSRALTKVSSDIATAIRAKSDGKNDPKQP
jgi:uncharacterized lipoprotein YmbA